jgi:hypothetical protein
MEPVYYQRLMVIGLPENDEIATKVTTRPPVSVRVHTGTNWLIPGLSRGLIVAIAMLLAWRE